MNGRAWRGIATLLMLMTAGTLQAAQAPGELTIYFIDVEGGQSTLVVTPARETLLIDAGFAGAGDMNSIPGDPTQARDPNRILAAMRDAGVDRIDYLMITHFHRDHIGGIPELTQLVPVGAFIDHGDAYPPEDRARADLVDALDARAYDDYLPLRARAKHLLATAGEHLPLKGVETTIVSANRQVLAGPLAGAGSRNTTCGPAAMKSSYPGDENTRSNGVVLSFGKFRFLDVGDLNDQPLYDLVCPIDQIGLIDVYLVAHHGNTGASDPATLAAFQPRAAVVNNAPRKGGRTPTLKMLADAKQVDAWQLHVSSEAGASNAPPERVANLDDTTAHWFKVVAKADGSFTLANGRTGQVKAYGVR
jgi:competence protein ComEC